MLNEYQEQPKKGKEGRGWWPRAWGWVSGSLKGRSPPAVCFVTVNVNSYFEHHDTGPNLSRESILLIFPLDRQLLLQSTCPFQQGTWLSGYGYCVPQTLLQLGVWPSSCQWNISRNDGYNLVSLSLKILLVPHCLPFSLPCGEEMERATLDSNTEATWWG